MTFAAGFLLLLWVVASILVNGIALLHCLTKLRGLELFGYGAARRRSPPWPRRLRDRRRAGGALGFRRGADRFFPRERRLFLRPPDRARNFPSPYPGRSKSVSGLWFLLLVFCLGLLHVDVRLPDPLPDGIYIFKTPTTNVKIQHLTSTPADNYIPYAVAEFFLRGVSFEKERPILPGNEVSNRTILMSLVALPFRVALGAPRDHPQLGTYHYLGRDWPDVSKLYAADSFEQFAIVGLVLNSLLLLGLLVFCAGFGAGSLLPAATLLYITNPYFIGADDLHLAESAGRIFYPAGLEFHPQRAWRARSWPLSWPLAFHSHPYAIVFAGWAGLFYLTQWRRAESRLPAVIPYVLVFALVARPLDHLDAIRFADPFRFGGAKLRGRRHRARLGFTTHLYLDPAAQSYSTCSARQFSWSTPSI